MKKILIISQAPSGGVGRHIANLIDGLEEQMDFYVLYNPEFADASFKNWLKQSSNVKGITTPYLIREINPVIDLKAIIYIYKKIKEVKPDVVHTHSSKAGAVGRIAAKMAGIENIVYTPHAYAFLSKEFSSRKSKIFICVERILSRHFTRKTINVSISEKNAALSKKIDCNDKFMVIPNAIPSKEFYDVNLQRKRLGIDDPDIFIVGNIARVAEQKNPDFFVEVAKIVKQKDSSIVFFWVGYKEKRLANYSIEEENEVNFVGEMVQTDDLVAAFNLYFCTSIFEGMSYSLLEAADAGVPVLLSNVEGNNDFADIYTASELFDLSDAPSIIADKIIDYKKRHNEHVGQVTYSYKKMISAIKDVYEQG
jgi:glycosyltransferase involved in cell wall biosynthesis